MGTRFNATQAVKPHNNFNPSGLSSRMFSDRREQDFMNVPNEASLTPEELRLMRRMTNMMLDTMTEMEGGEDLLTALEEMMLAQEYENEPLNTQEAQTQAQAALNTMTERK